jgi:hypothetical protein
MQQRADSLHLSLELELRTEPISGRVEDERGLSTEFKGLLELVSAMDSLRRAPSSSAQATMALVEHDPSSGGS